MKKNQCKGCRRENARYTVTKIPVTVIEETDKKSEAVQKFKIIVPENEYPEPIKLKMKIVEEQREEQKIVLKEN